MGKLKKVKHLLQVLVSVTKEEQKIPIVSRVEKKDLLKDKIALVTGGSGGIGGAIVKKLVASGCTVVIAGINEEKLKQSIKENGASQYIVMNMNNVSEFDDKIANVAQIYGKIDILVHTAGIHTKRDNLDFLNITEDEYDRVMDVNLKGTYFTCQSVGKYMANNNIKGHICVISSQSALEPSWSPYRLSKFGISGLTKGIAQKLLPYGIIVNSVAPGPTATTMQDMGVNGSIYTSDSPIGRYAMPDEIAEYVLMLVSGVGDMVVGETLYISGGRGITDVR